jgi:hypothetical protein
VPDRGCEALGRGRVGFPILNCCERYLVSLPPGDPGAAGHPAPAPHPPPCLRIPIISAFLATLEQKRPKKTGEVVDETANDDYCGAARLYTEIWSARFPQVNDASHKPYLDDTEKALVVIMDTPLEALGGHTGRELASFSPDDRDLVTHVFQDYLSRDVPSGESIAPRLAVASARLAFDRIVEESDRQPDMLRRRLGTLQENLLRTIESNRPEGTRALPSDEERDAIIRRADAFAEQAVSVGENWP